VGIVISTGPKTQIRKNHKYGNIETAENASVNNGNNTVGSSAVNGSGIISVDPIRNQDPGEVYFANNGTISGSGGTWEFRDTFQQVQIINNSSSPLQVNGINVVNTMKNPIVDLLNTMNPVQLTFNIIRTVLPSFVDIESFHTSMPVISLNGAIENPIGTTRIVNWHGNIQSTASRANGDDDPSSLIRTNILDLETPQGSVGQNPGDAFGQTPNSSQHRVNVDMVDSANVPAPTSFQSAQVSGLDGSIYLGRNAFFTGELVKYMAATALGGLTSGDYYYVIASADGLSIKLESVTDPKTPIIVTPTATPADEHSLTPAQFFTVATSGDAYLDVKARLREGTAPTRSPVTDYSVVVDAVNTGGDANLLLRGSVQDTAASGTVGDVSVEYAGHTSGELHHTFFNTPDPAGPGLDPAVFVTGAFSHRDSTYDFRALDTNGNPYLPGITARHDIIVAAADPLAASPALINVQGITQLSGGPFPAPASSDQHHIDVLTNGNITLAEAAGDLRVGRIMSTAHDVTLNSQARIIDALAKGPGDEANVTGVNITLTADNSGITGTSADMSGTGGIGTPDNFLETNVDALYGSGATLGLLNVTDTAADVGNTAGVFLTEVQRGAESRHWLGTIAGEVDDLELDTVNTHGDVSLATSNGSIVDARSSDGTPANKGKGKDTANVIGNTIDLYAKGGNIGSVPTSNVYLGGVNQGVNNDLEIESQAYVAYNPHASNPNEGTIGARADNSIYLTDVAGSVPHAASNANVVLLQAATGDVRFTVRDSNQNSSGVYSDLDLLASGSVLFLENNPETVTHGLINAITGSVLLRVGDNIKTDPNAQILAGQNINIYGDFQRVNENSSGTPETDVNDPNYGTIMHLSGVIAHGSSYLASIFGNVGNDQIYFDQTFLGGTNPAIPGDQNGDQAIPYGGGMLSAYSGGKTRAYGSNTPTPANQFAPAGSGADYFVVNELQTMNAADGTGDTLTLDGQGGGNTYIINTAGSQHGTNNYVINVLDSGAPDSGTNQLMVYGSADDIDPTTGLPYSVNNIFLTRRVKSIPNETSNRPTLYQDSPAFVAVLHTSLKGAQANEQGNQYVTAGSFPVERVNYDTGINRLMVFGQTGNNYFASDDVTVATTLDGGSGNNTFQIGQIYGLRRDGSSALPPNLGSTLGGSLQPQDVFPQVPTALTPQDIYGTVATTRGWLSAGASAPLLAQGGSGNNTFIVYSNQAPVRLEGHGGDNLFIVRAFALAQTDSVTGDIDWIDPVALIAQPRLTSGFSTAAETDVRTGDGNNQVEYNIDAPLSIDGGSGFNKLVVLGTEYADHIVVTSKAIYGAGLSVTYTHIQVVEIDALQGDDTIDVLSTAPGVAYRVVGDEGNNTINVAGDVDGDVISHDVNGTSASINQQMISADQEYNDIVTDGIDLSVARPTQGQVIIDQSNIPATVTENNGSTYSYGVYLAVQPLAGTQVYVTVSAPLAPQDELGQQQAIGYTDLLANGDIADQIGNEDTVLLSANPANFFNQVVLNGTSPPVSSSVIVPRRAIVLVFDHDHWNKAGQLGAGEQTVYVQAAGDAASDTDRVVAVSHSVVSNDPYFDHALVQNVEVTVQDSTKPAIRLTQLNPTITDNSAYHHPTDGATTVLMGTTPPTNPATAVTDLYAIELAAAPAANKTVQVDINPQDSQVVLSDDLTDNNLNGNHLVQDVPATADAPGVYHVTFNSSNWNIPVLVTVQARNISTPQDPHDTPIIQSIDTTATTDQGYEDVASTDNQRLDVNVISDQTAGLFQQLPSSQIIVQAGTPSTGPGQGSSYTMRLTKQPSANDNVFTNIITDGQTDITAGGSVSLTKIGNEQPSQLFQGNITISGATITLASGSETGSFLLDGFAVGMPIQGVGIGSNNTDYTIASIAANGQSMTLQLPNGQTPSLAQGAFSNVSINQQLQHGFYSGNIAYNRAAAPFVLFHGDVDVNGTTVTMVSRGASFVNANFAPGETIQIGNLPGKFTVASVAADGQSMTLTTPATNMDTALTGVDLSKLLDTLVRTDGSSWLDSGFLEGQLFEISGTGINGLDGKMFKIDLVTGTVPNKLNELVLTDHSPLSLSPTSIGSGDVLPGSSIQPTFMTVRQWAAQVTFTPSDWYQPVTIPVVADPWFDVQPGHQNIKSFPKQLHLLSDIQGPLMVEGGPTAVDTSLRPALMLPGEQNGPFFGVATPPPESQAINTLNIFDDGSVQNLTGSLSSTTVSGLGMPSGTLDFTSLLKNKPLPSYFQEPGNYPLGISYGSISLDQNGNFSPIGNTTTIQVLNVMLGAGNDNFTVTSTMIPGPFHNEDGTVGPMATHGGITAIHGGGNQLLQVVGTTDANAAFDVSPGQIVREDGLSWAASGFTVGQQVLVNLSGTLGVTTGSYTVTGFGDVSGGAGSVMFLSAASGSPPLPTEKGATGVVSVTDYLQVTATSNAPFNVPTTADRIVRTDGNPWQSIGFQAGQQISVTGIPGTGAVVGFDNSSYGFGTALLVSGLNLSAGNFTGTVAVTSRYQSYGQFTLSNRADGFGHVTRSDGTTWASAGFAVGQVVVIPGVAGNLTVTGFGNSGYDLLVTGGALTAGSVTGTVGVVRLGGNNIKVTGSSKYVSQTFTLDPAVAGDPAGTVGRITRTDVGGNWVTDDFTTGQQVSISGGGQSGQFVVTGTANNGTTLLVSGGTGFTFPTQEQTGVPLTVDIDSPLVVYGNTSQDGVWYSGDPTKLSLHDFGPKPMPRQNNLSVQVSNPSSTSTLTNPFTLNARQTGEPASAFVRITRTDQTWSAAGFIPLQPVTLSGVGAYSGTFNVVGPTTGYDLVLSPISGGTNPFAFTPGTSVNNLTATEATVGLMQRTDGNSWISAGFTVEGMIAVGKPLSVTFARSPLGDTISRNDGGNWSTDGFTTGQTIVVSGTANNDRTYTIAGVSLNGSTLTLTVANTVTAEGPETASISGDVGVVTNGGAVGVVSNISPSTLTLINIGPGFAALGSGSYTVVQWNRLGNGAPDFVFPVANPYQYAGNNVIDASQLYADIPDGQLPPIGLTIYGGPGNDTIIGSQAGDQIAGGSGNNVIQGGRGANDIYGADGFNVNLITRALQIVTTNSSSNPDHDPLKAGNNLIYGQGPGQYTKTDPYGDYDNVIFGAMGRVVQDVAGPRDTTQPLPSLPQDLQTTLRARKIVSEAVQNAGNNIIYGSGGQNILIGGSGSNSIQGGNERDLIFGHNVSLDRSDYAISSATWSNGTVTITTSVANGFAPNVANASAPGEWVTISGMTPSFLNGSYVITVTSPTTFTYTQQQATGSGTGTGSGTVTHRGNFTNPRFQALSGTQIYSTTLGTAGQAQLNGVQQLDPRGSPRWGDYLISLLDTGFNAPAGTFANDYIAGGGADNAIFGEMGNNVIEGAGSIDYVSHLEQSLAINSASWSNNTATITTSVANGFINGESVAISGMTPAAYNGTYTITVTSPTTFTYTLTLATNPGAGTALGIATGLDLASLGGRVGVNNADPTNVAGNPFRDKSNALELYPSCVASTDGDNYIEGGGGNNIIFGGGAQSDIIGGNSDLFSHPNSFSDIAISAASCSNGTATITTSVANGFVSGESVTIAGMTPSAYNGAYVITVTSPTTFTFALATNPVTAAAFGTATPANNQTSNAFNNTRTQRQSGSNLIFGGGGNDTYRDDLGSDTSVNRHAQNSDMIISNNGDIFRLVGVTVNGQVMLAPPTGTGSVGGVATFNGCLAFNYDNYSNTQKIIPRAGKLLDYTPGGPAYTPTSAQSLLDIGGISEIHAENGDAFVFGEAGRQYTPSGYNGQILQSAQYGNIIFGGSGDDQIVGGYGNNWITGGTGNATIIGQDGRIFVSRNGLSEPLNGVTAIPKNQLNQEIYTPGHIQDAIINVAGQLKSTVDLEPFSEDATYNASQPEWNFGFTAPHQSDDIIFAGTGNATVHGGSGDDAISGGQALAYSFLQTEYSPGQVGIAESDWYHPYNPGNTLRFNPIDPSGTHPPKEVGRTGQFALYDEFDPRRKILLNADGTANKTGTGLPWFLDLNAGEQDGNDVLFGDLGNNWIVAGTGQNDLYGGFGNDLLDARSSQDIDGGLNDQPDYTANITNRAFGGAGKDVLIADNAANRLIDWVGNFNTYIVPFSQWGMPTVSRTVQPQLPQFLYALSQSDGADETLAADYGTDPTRNGEPAGEMGLVLQHDAAWHLGTGAPSDQPAGNIAGTKRVIMSASTFNGNQAPNMFVDSGTWTTAANYYQAAAATGGDAVSLLGLDEPLPSYFEMLSTFKMTSGGTKQNAFFIFNYQGPTNFMYAGLDASQDLLRIGQRTTAGWIDSATLAYNAKPNSNYSPLLALNGATATLTLGSTSLSYTFSNMLNTGMIGIGANSAVSTFTWVQAQKLPRVFTYQEAPTISSTGLSEFTVQSGQGSVNSTATRYSLTPGAAGVALSTRPLNVAPSSYVEFQATVNGATNGTWAGLAFAYTSPNDFLFTAIVPGTNQVILGHRNSSGWFIDAVSTQTITAGTDYTLQVDLDSTPQADNTPSTVNVVLNGASVLGYTYNIQFVGGPQFGNLQLGLLARSGAASFYNLAIRGDDPAYANGGTPQLAAAPAPTSAGAISPLAASQLQPIVQAAIARWDASPALQGNDAQLLQQVQVTIAPLPGLMLGQTIGNSIVINPTAAGYGWFVDTRPLDDSEFHRGNTNGLLVANLSSPALFHMDLETVVMHELGHVLGLDDVDLPTSSGDLMATSLTPGVRRLPDGLSPVLDGATTVPTSSGTAKSLLAGTTPQAGVVITTPTAAPFTTNGLAIPESWVLPGWLSGRTMPAPQLDATSVTSVGANAQAPQNIPGQRPLLDPTFWAVLNDEQRDQLLRQWREKAYLLSLPSMQEDLVPESAAIASSNGGGLSYSTAGDIALAEWEMGVPLLYYHPLVTH
jgi:hypothetical protein